jgi:histidine phosphotransferase ChpT
MSKVQNSKSPEDHDDSPAEADPDALALSALLSSRVCHDLINPVGAIGSGLEVLDDPSMDGAMREAAQDLIRSGASKAIALLSYARLAYGAAGGYGAQISLEDAQKALTDLYETVKPALDWRIGGGMADKEKVKVLLVLGYAAAECVPRGGSVVIDGSIDDFSITATGKKVLLQDDLVRALGGDAHDIAPRFTPALIASQLADAKGGRISAVKQDETVVLAASFAA